MTLEPDRDGAARFLAALDPDTDRFTFQTFDDDPERRKRRKENKDPDPFASILHGSLASRWDTLVKLNTQGAGVFVTVNATDLKGRSGDNITRVRAYFVDLDGAEFPDPPHVLPHIITETSPGRWHLYWRVKDVALDKFAATQQRLISHYSSDPTVHDLPRVMRLPGFYHRKGAPFLSRLVEVNDEPPYTLDQVVAGLPDEPTPKERPASASSGANTFWEQINAAAFDHRDAWVRSLFPTASYHSSADTYRVSSADLGRGLQEDLVIGARGIRDFGREIGLTPIDCVLDFGTERTPVDAALWLCRQLGVRPESLGFGGSHGRAEPPLRTNGRGSGIPDENVAPASPPPLPYVDLSRDLVPRQWLVPDRIPMFNVALLSGEGSIGKSLLLMQLAGAVVLGGFWIGMRPQKGPVLYVSCEEDDDEVRRRAEDVAGDLGRTREMLIECGLRILSFAGKDAILAQPDRNGIMRPTPLFERIRHDALQLVPKLIVIDTVADTFGGKEMDRAQTRQFITMQRGLAIECAAAVVMSAHPSLTGINTDSGLSGSTGWHNSVRARLYLKRAPGDDTTLRALEIKKNNYGPVSETVLLRWRDGVYHAEGVGVPEEQADRVLERLAQEEKNDRLFLTLLQRFAKQGRNVSDKTGTSYAPAQFAREPEAKAAKVTGKALAEAMIRLFAANKLKVATEGPPSHPRTRLVETLPPTKAEVLDTPPATYPVTTGTSEPSTASSTDLPPTSTGGVCTAPLIPPNPVEGGKGAVEAPAPSTGKEGEDAAEVATGGGFEVIGAEPDWVACSHCGKCEGTVYLIRDPSKSVRTEPLHEHCAKAWFAR